MSITRVVHTGTILENIHDIIHVLQNACIIQAAIVHIHVTDSRTYMGINCKFGEITKFIVCITQEYTFTQNQ